MSVVRVCTYVFALGKLIDQGQKYFFSKVVIMDMICFKESKSNNNSNSFFISEVMARSTSIIEAIDRLRQGMLLWKIRDKGVRSLKPFPRHYKLDMADLRITYLPNKNMTAKSCTAGGPGASAWIDLCTCSSHVFTNPEFTKP